MNYCLNALVNKGLVKVGNFRNSDNKLSYAYLLTPRGIKSKAVVTAHFLQRKMAEYEALKTEIAALKREVAQNDTVNVVSNPTNAAADAATNAATTTATKAATNSLSNSVSNRSSRK